jgi:hypothetical protein
MTNAQSWQTIDCVIRNLYFELGVDFVPASIIANHFKLLYICSANRKLVHRYSRDIRTFFH